MMAWFGMGSSTPKCCCGATGSTCTLLSDSLNRADDTDLGSEWDEEAGGAEISSNTLLVNVNGSQIIGNDPNPDSAQTSITCLVRLAGSSSTARLFLGWANTSSYLYATLSTTAITVGQAGGGSQSEAVTITPGTWYTFTLCYNGTQLVGTANGVQAMKTGLSPPGLRHGVGCGTANVSFDDVLAKKVSTNCAPCVSIVPVGECSFCVENEIQSYWIADVNGITTVPGAPAPRASCPNCEVMNGLYIFDDVQGGSAPQCLDGLTRFTEVPWISGCDFTTWSGTVYSPTARLAPAVCENVGGGVYHNYSRFTFFEDDLGTTVPDMAWLYDHGLANVNCHPATLACTAIDGTVLTKDPTVDGYYQFFAGTFPGSGPTCVSTGSTVTISRYTP